MATATKKKEKVIKFKKGSQTRKTALAVIERPQNIMQLISDAARDPHFDIAKFEALLVARRSEQKDVAARSYNIAMRKTQAEMPSVVKTLKNTITDSKYAPLEEIQRKCMPFIYANGFSLSFYEEDAPQPDQKRICVDIMHVDGHTEKKHVDLHPDILGPKGNPNKTPMHADGSTFSYGRRYLTGLIFNIRIVGEDDDGNQGAGEFANKEEVSEIRALLKELEINEGDAMKKAKLESLDKIPLRTYANMIIGLKQRKQQRETAKAK